MALRHPAPLTEKEWDSLMVRLNRIPNEEYKIMIRKMVENGRKIKVHV